MWGSQLYSHGEGKQMDRYLPHPTVILTKAGQPPIGKPPNRLATDRQPSRSLVFTGIPSLTILPEILRFVETLQRVSKSAEVGP